MTRLRRWRSSTVTALALVPVLAGGVSGQLAGRRIVDASAVERINGAIARRQNYLPIVANGQKSNPLGPCVQSARHLR